MEKTFEIKDNFLNRNYFNELQSIVTGNTFAWYYQPYDTESYEPNNMMFAHMLYREGNVNSEWYKFFKPIAHLISEIEPWSYLTRIKLNCYPNHSKKIIFNKHVDDESGRENMFNAVLHMNTCNGETILIDNKQEIKIKSRENKLIVFNNSIEHYGTSQTDTHLRILINFSFIRE